MNLPAMNKLKRILRRSLRFILGTGTIVLVIGVMSLPPDVAYAAAATPLPISQIPLTVSLPVHPQVVFALGNSQSMDGDLSGAIYTGSGALSSALGSLATSSSPVNYTVPAGFVPPLTPTSLVTAPFTTNSSGGAFTSGTQYDNSASRLNVAKQGITAILNQYMPSTDFALMDYNATASSPYTTWLYLMSPDGGFSFSSTNTSPPAGTRYVDNPCYGYTTASSTVQSNCGSIAGAGLYSSAQLSEQYVLISQSSDDPDINDVLYATGGSGVFDDYNGPHPASPFPPNFSLGQYNLGNILVTYNSVAPGGNARQTGPTNAGYVPYSTQVMYAQRGFGYYSTAAATSGKTIVGMTSAGPSPSATSTATAIAQFTPSLAPETSNPGTKDIKALAVQSPLAGLLNSAQSLLAGSVPSSSNGCAPPKQYVVLITDGLPTQDLGNKLWPPLGSASAAGYGVIATFNADGSLNSTNDQALTDTITKITALNAAGIQTYVVGMGNGVDVADNPEAAHALTAMAVAGGTGSASATGYFPATSPQDLVTDLQLILTSISNQNGAGSSAAINSTSLNTTSQLYQATFNPGPSTGDAWIGDLQEIGITANGVIATTATWSAQTQLDAVGSRHIATWDAYHKNSPTSPVTPAAVDFTWSNLSATLQAELQPSDTKGSLRLDYLRGSHTAEKSNGGTFRDRQHLLGDIVNSSPAYVGPPNGSYGDVSYSSFVIAQAAREPMIYVGANDGMLHGVDAANGNELMGFIPGSVFGNLYKLSDPLYYFHHQYFVDGSPDVQDVMLSDGAWHTLLVGGENAGGNSIYAMDVTDPAAFTSDSAVASAVKWEFTDTDMGLSYSAPIIVRSNAVTVTDGSSGAAVNGFAVLFGNGYNSSSERPIFYAVDASTGAVLRKIDLCGAAGVPPGACNSSVANGLSSMVAANSSGVLGIPQDMAYAGDLQGNLWAINMANANPALWTVKLLFQARDPSGNDQPITTKPSLTLNPHFPDELGLMVYFGTGRFIATGDLTTTGVQTFYGIWDNTGDLSNYPTGSTPVPPYHRADLQSQTLSLGTYTPSTGPNVSVVLSTNNPVNLTYNTETVSNPSPPPPTLSIPPVEGWYYDLSPLGSGARSFTNSLVANGGVQASINIPPGSSCGTPSSYLMNVMYSTGGPFSDPSIGLNGGTSVGGSVNGSHPTGVQVTHAYSSSPTSVPTNNGTNLTILNTSNGLKSVPTLGTVPSHVGWWQIK